MHDLIDILRFCLPVAIIGAGIASFPEGIRAARRIMPHDEFWLGVAAVIITNGAITTIGIMLWESCPQAHVFWADLGRDLWKVVCG